MSKWIVVLGLLCSAAGDDLIGAVKNVNVNVVHSEQTERTNLKLNVSWSAPEFGTPSYYIVRVSNVQSPNRTSCTEGSINYAGTDNGTVLPENKFGSVDDTELDIEPGCTYKVQVQTIPTGKITTVNYTVPDCVGGRCNCDDVPEALHLVVEAGGYGTNNDSVLINWKLPDGDFSLVKTYTVSLGVPHLISSSGLTVYNKTQIFLGNESSFLWNLNGNLEEGTKIFVSAKNLQDCNIAEGSLLLKISRHYTRKSTITFIAAGLMVLFLTVSVIFGYVRHLSKSPNYKLISLGKQSSRQITSVLNNAKIESILKYHNILYFEQENQGANKGKKKEPLDPLEISPGRVRVTRELGRGQFGRVYLADLLEATPGPRVHRAVAVKTSLLLNNDKRASEVRQQMLEEISIIKTAGPHPHLVGLVGYCTKPKNPICLLLEYMEGGDLLCFLHKKRDLHNGTAQATGETKTTRKSGRFNPADDEEMQQRNRFATEIAKGMAHLETVGIVHRDLAARNILINDNLVLKISDFGLSRDGGEYIIGTPGLRRLPIRWMPAEAIRRRAFTSKSDVWSYGVVLWEIATLGEFPYAKFTNDSDLLHHLLEEGGHPEVNELMDLEMRELMAMCWAVDPENRPNFGQLLEWLETRTSTTCKSNPGYLGIGGMQIKH